MRITSDKKFLQFLDQAEDLAIEKADGHLTIMRFTSCWKVMLGTPNLDCGDGREEVRNLKSFYCLHDALRNLIETSE